MSKVKGFFYSVFRASFFTKEAAFIFCYVVVLLLIVIYSAHSIDKKVIKISDLNEERRELRAIYVDTHVVLTQLEIGSSIMERAKEMGLQQLKTPPQKIKVTD